MSYTISQNNVYQNDDHWVFCTHMHKERLWMCSKSSNTVRQPVIWTCGVSHWISLTYVISGQMLRYIFFASVHGAVFVTHTMHIGYGQSCISMLGSLKFGNITVLVLKVTVWDYLMGTLCHQWWRTFIWLVFSLFLTPFFHRNIHVSISYPFQDFTIKILSRSRNYLGPS